MKGANILFVDDDAEERIIIKELLEAQHYRAALYFEDGKSVLSHLQHIIDDKFLPRIIITDINMPVMSGLELLTILKANKRYRNIKVIMLSTGGKQRYMDKCLKLGATEYLEKPSTFTEMKKLANYFTLL